MRAFAVAVGSLSCLALPASAEPLPPEQALDNPAYSEPTVKWTSIEEVQTEDLGITLPEQIRRDLSDSANCRDVIQTARAANGLPPLLDRQTASPDEVHRFYAVDRRQDGCSVMVAMGNREDIRPLPERTDGPLFNRVPAKAASAAPGQ